MHSHVFIINKVYLPTPPPPPFVCILGLCLWHMEVSRLGFEWELHLPTYTIATTTWDPSCVCNLHHYSWHRWILNPLSEARGQTHILMDTSQVCN